MLIRFLRYCEVPQNFTQVLCDCCGPVPMGAERTPFYKGQEEDPNVPQHEIHLAGLKYRVDYEIIEYP